MPSFEIGEDRCRLRFTWERHGQDLRLHIGGGADHVGAMALAARGKDSAVHIEVSSAPGHREADLVRPAAEKICETLGVTACVSAGVHLDRITREEIAAILQNAAAGTRKLIEMESAGGSTVMTISDTGS